MALIRYWHFRLYSWLHDGAPPYAKGGATVCAIIEGEKVRLGAIVCSLKDVYCKAKGREEAFSWAQAVPDITLFPLPCARVLAAMVSALAHDKARAIHKGKGGMLK